MWVRLALAPEVGPVIARNLLQRFGTPRAIFSASRSELLTADGLGEKRCDGLLASSAAEGARQELNLAERHQVRLIPLDAEDYPPQLKSLASPPLVLYVKGELKPEDRIALAVVGPRKPSEYARMMAASLIPPLCARGVTIVSGLAAGIDAESHVAALGCGGRTIAVLGQALDTPVFPSTNRDLATRIIREERGALVSVFPFGTGPDAGNFPRRNEIIAALSLGVLIIEAGEKSGALITAGHAAELGRTVMACPGDATRSNARGSNRLIADGAVLVQKSDDILEALAGELRRASVEVSDKTHETHATHKTHETEATDSDEIRAGRVPGRPASSIGPISSTPVRKRPQDKLEGHIWDLLDAEHRPIDFIIEDCADAGYSQSEVVHKLLLMEMSGLIRQLPGRVFSLVP